jgi:hypothetical protein
MIIGIEDNDKKNFAFSVEAMVLLVPDGTEHCKLYVGHINGVFAHIHLTPAEFMSRIGAALESMQGRAALLGMARGPGPKQ